MKHFLSALMVALFLITPPASDARSRSSAAVTSSQPTLYSTESEAHAHCPRDVVVWLNTKTGVYHEQGMRWYGRTKQGAYVCQREANAAGDRDTRNGQ